MSNETDTTDTTDTDIFDEEASNDLLCFKNDYETLESFQNCVKEHALSRMRYMSPSQAAIFTAMYAIISLIGLIGNGLVMTVVARNKEMRTNRNVFIVNLALSNFVLALILVPFLWMPTYRIEFQYGAFMCKVAQSFPGANIFCSTLTVSAIAVDRYYAVVTTRLGPGKMKVIQATLIAASIWIVSFLLSILYLLHFNTKDYTLPAEYIPRHILDKPSTPRVPDEGLLLFQRCELQPHPCLDVGKLSESWNSSSEACYKFYETAVSAIMAGFIYVVPMPILVIFSVLLTRFLKKNERQHSVMRQRSQLANTMKTSFKKSTGGGCGMEDNQGETSTNLIHNVGGGSGRMGHQRALKRSTVESSSSGSSNTRPRRSRTTSLLFAMAFSNALLWLPFTIVSLFIQLAPNHLTRSLSDVLRQLDDAAKLISMLSICVNPFLYGYLNTNFKREFKLIFRKFLPCCLSGAHSRSSSGRNVVLMTTPAGTSILRDKDSLALNCVLAGGQDNGGTEETVFIGR